MDIRFACDKCGQQLVIDEAGAGLTIQCPTCGVNLTVPKSVPDSLTQSAETTSQKLYHQCRDLVYELRVEDAIRVLEQAEKADAEEKGYELSEMFRFHGTAAGMIESAKWAITRSLQNMTPKEEEEMLGAVICGQLLRARQEDEILVVTLGSKLKWPALEEWFWRFKEANCWPATWEVYPVGTGEPVVQFFERNVTQPTDPMLYRMHSLSLAARRLSHFQRLHPEYAHHYVWDYDKATEELLSEGLAVRCRDLPVADRLCMLPISKVREIQRAHGAKGARSKEQIVKNLLSLVEEQQLAAELPPDNSLKVNVDYRQLDRYWFEYARSKLLTRTFDSMMLSYRDYHDYQGYGLPRRRMRALLGEQCSFCAEAAKRMNKLKDVMLDALPPFHPGCTCCVE